MPETVQILNSLSFFRNKTSSNIAGKYFYDYMSLMSESNKNGNDYRFGFQGQEADNVIKGDGNSINYKYRVHDPRLGRFLSIDPLSAKFPWNSPYSFAMNRVIDGVELEGLEYVTYLVKVYNDGSGAVVLKLADYRNNPNFNYGEYSQSFGPRGKGVEYIYVFYDENNNPVSSKTVMEIEQGGKFSYSALGRHGFYYGQGAKTMAGSLFEVGTTGNSYDWGIGPVDEVDLIAMNHDIDQEIRGTFDWMEDNRTIWGDKDAIAAWDAYLEEHSRGNLVLGTDKVTGRRPSNEALYAAFNGSLFFSALVRYKEWKITYMREKGLDPWNPEDMKNVSISNWDPQWYQFRQVAAKKLLESGNEKASE